MARVLVVDNDPDALELALLDLGLEGHTVLGAAHANRAMELLDEFGPEVLVLDHRMPPGPTGLALARRLHTTHPDLRVVIYSNYQDVDLVRQAEKIGVAFLPKGNLRTLRDAIGA